MKSNKNKYIDSSSFKFQKELSVHPFIKKQKGFYSSYWDTGLFGNYFLIEPEKSVEAIQYSLDALSSKYCFINRIYI